MDETTTIQIQEQIEAICDADARAKDPALMKLAARTPVVPITAERRVLAS